MTSIADPLADDAEQCSSSISTANTIVPRYIAAALDNVIAMLLAVIAAKSVDKDSPLLASVLLVAAFLGYYFVPEFLFSRTPGKLLTGLVVVGTDGRRCTWRQVAIRTAFRLLEVNPLLLGAMPAALSVVLSKHRQRFGDRVAKTLVVASNVLR